MYKSLLIFLTIIYGLLNSSVFAQTGITFSFANVTITGSSPKFFEFDVMAQAGAGGTSIGDNLVYVNYNTLGFGSNIADNAKITVTKGTLVGGELAPGFPLYNLISVQDNSSSRVAVTYELQFANNGNGLPTSATDLFHVSIEILNESETAGLSFDQGLMTGQQFEDDNSTQYSPVTASDTDDSSLPVELTSFSSEMTSGLVTLKWTTESEINNLGFEIYRSMEEDSLYILLSSYKFNEDLVGQGNSSTKHFYTYTDTELLVNQTYWYKLADVDLKGIKTYHGPLSILVESRRDDGNNPNNIPNEFELSQNYPNPFNPETYFNISIPNVQDIGELTINIYDIIGKKVKTLFEGKLFPGVHLLKWDGKDDSGKFVSGGTYFYYLKCDKYYEIKKMIMLK